MTFDLHYAAERQSPKRGEDLYIHLSDIQIGMEATVKSLELGSGMRILDLGAGTSPYKYLFPDCNYLRADVTEESRPDLLLTDETGIPENDGTFDLIISTQVIEHVWDPQAYLNEAYRLLKPSGKLLISLPTLYEDHKCPNDYQRWMRQGLLRDLERTGFRNIAIQKVTVGARSIVFFWDRYISSMHSSRRKINGILHLLLRSLYLSPIKKITHYFSDKIHKEYRVVTDDEDIYTFYVNLIAVCDK